MKNRAVCLLIVFVLFLTGAQGHGLGQDKPWWGGLYLGAAGYSEQSGLPASEYLGDAPPSRGVGKVKEKER